MKASELVVGKEYIDIGLGRVKYVGRVPEGQCFVGEHDFDAVAPNSQGVFCTDAEVEEWVSEVPS